MRWILAIIFLQLLGSIDTFASQDRYLLLSELKMVSPGIEDTGRVSITAELSGEVWQSVKIETFGKTYELDEKQLALLKGIPAHTMQLTFSPSEHCVNLEFKKLVTNDRQELVEQVFFVSISKNDGMQMQGPLTGEVFPKR